MKKRSDKEQIIQFLLSLPQEHDKNGYYVTVGKYNSNFLDITEKDFIEQLSQLEIDEFVKLSFPGSRRILDNSITVYLNSSVVHYFEDKKHNKKQRRNKWIQFWIPVGISALTLLWNIFNSIYSLYLKEQINDLMKLLN